MDKRIIKALNEQLIHEITNFWIYKNFSGIADGQSLTGATVWFDKQSMEEYSHFNGIFSFLCDKNVIPTLSMIPEQPSEKITLTEMFKRTVATETGTTEMLQKLYDLATILKEGQVQELALKYLKEQIEEEKLVGDIYARLLLAGEGLGTILIDQELASR
jgi:ferritin